MTVVSLGLIFQPVFASLHYTQTCTYKNDTIITLEGKNLTLLILHQSFKKKDTKGNIKKEIHKNILKIKQGSQFKTWH